MPLPLVSAILLASMARTVPQRVVSPEVKADRTVTFRFRAPNAKKVEVNVEGNGTLGMTQIGEVWSVTTKPLVPDMYGYSISVDGVAMLDPLNSVMKPNLIWPGNLVTVPGMPPEVWESQDVPHGAVTRHFYKSSLIGDQRDYYVYTPAGYRTGKAKLPVLYLLHGYSDSANGWTAVGQAHVILDNLISQGKVKPMIVVMPLGYGVSDFAAPGSKGFGDLELVKQNYTRFRDALIGEVIPQVEKDYRVLVGRQNRAIAGLSMGGAESLFTGLSRVDLFGSIGAFSSAPLPGNDPSIALKDLDVAKAKELKVFWMACGTADSLIGFQRGFSKWSAGRGLDLVTKETAGGHEWMLWRRNLAEFAQTLFR